MKLIIIGPAGSGKGTQAKLISENYKIPHISTGDLIREEIASGSVFGGKLEQIINKGSLVPDEDVLKLLKKKLDASKNGFILDGYPRNLNQAKTLDEIAEIGTVIFLNVKDDEVVRRLSTRWQCKNCGEIYNTDAKPEKNKGKCDKCGSALYQRDDDKPEAIKKRLDIFHKETRPIIDFYRKKGVLKEIQQKEKPDQVFTEVKKILG
ncbi:MAG: adenylate kinase [Candidatus Aenigmarchaeota archaeon]|nr:adenylate kinase [Candidatus Aenigmarchaeota archaeon]